MLRDKDGALDLWRFLQRWRTDRSVASERLEPAAINQPGCRDYGESGTKIVQCNRWSCLQGWDSHLLPLWGEIWLYSKIDVQTWSRYLTYSHFRYVLVVHEGQKSRSEGEIHPIPLIDQSRAMSPIHAHLAKRLPKWWRWEAFYASCQPNLVEHA